MHLRILDLMAVYVCFGSRSLSGCFLARQVKQAVQAYWVTAAASKDFYLHYSCCHTMAFFYRTIPVKSCGKFAEIRGYGGHKRWD